MTETDAATDTTLEDLDFDFTLSYTLGIYLDFSIDVDPDLVADGS